MAWTTPKTWSVGETLTAANFNTHIRDNLNAVPHLLAYKSADEIVNNSTVLQNDDALLFAVAANEVWYCEFVIAYVSSTVADIQFAFTHPAGATMTLTTFWGTAGGTAQPRVWNTSGSANDLQGDTLRQVMVVSGNLQNAGTAGNLTLQWAQNTATVLDTKVLKGSVVLGMKLA